METRIQVWENGWFESMAVSTGYSVLKEVAGKKKETFKAVTVGTADWEGDNLGWKSFKYILN